MADKQLDRFRRAFANFKLDESVCDDGGCGCHRPKGPILIQSREFTVHLLRDQLVF